MASLTDLTPEAVEQAMDEFDRLGREAFLAKYGFGEAQRLYIVRDTKRYDIKAIVGAAMGYLPGREPLTHDEFSSGLHLMPLVQSLGFHAIDTDADEQSTGEPADDTETTSGGRTRNPRWSMEEALAECGSTIRCLCRKRLLGGGGGDAEVVEEGLHVDAELSVVAVYGGPRCGFASEAWAADTGEDGGDDLLA